ncbi:MAG TPA: 16S rRNA (cytidine(1402)-2'-O)-methyltransferase [bacterium]|nr:16S rRNA (cytidine(1402)-2'-O)-methyltransferase [bacterium]
MKAVGSLYLVSTPIGNLEDVSHRALRVLRDVRCIAAEDTRRTRTLLTHFGIHNHLESYHDHNKRQKTPVLIEWLESGRSVAVVSDAGTPGISDPAFYLVRESIRRNIPVIPVPGPVAAIAALTASGLPTDRFVFEGFLPVKKGRQKRIRALEKETRTLILYESPHRLLKTLKDCREVLGNRPMAVCRELTKRFEEIQRGTIDELTRHFTGRKIQGEFVLVIQGNNKKNEKFHTNSNYTR